MQRDLKVVSAAMLTWGLGESMFYIFQPIYIQQFGADPILIGTILGINGLVMAGAQMPSGYLADRYGRHVIMRFTWIFGALATCLMAWAPSLELFIAGMLLYGLSSSGVAPVNTYVQNQRGSWSVGKAVSFASAAYNLGGVAGPLLGGLIGQQFDLKTVYSLSAFIFVISTTIVFFARKETLSDQPSMHTEGHLFQNRHFLNWLPIIFIVMLAVSIPQPLAANYLQNQQSYSLSQIGQLGAIGAAGSVTLMLIFGHYPAGLAFLIGQGSVLLYSGLLWVGGSVGVYGLGYFLLGGYRLSRAMTLALVRPHIREKEVGFAFGLVESLNALALMAAPVIAGFIYDWRPRAIFSAGVLAILIALILSLIALRFMAKNYQSPAFKRHGDGE